MVRRRHALWPCFAAALAGSGVLWLGLDAAYLNVLAATPRRGPCPLSCCASVSGQADAGEEEQGQETVSDWRDVRAALVANQGSCASSDVDAADGWIHISPVLEVGSFLLAAAGAFALRRPELHKAVALLLEHRRGHRSVAIVLNRADPTERGPGFAGLGGTHRRLLRRSSAATAGSTEVLSFSGATQRVSVLRGIDVVQGDSMLPREEVLADVLGELCWAPGALQAEVDSGLWVAAAADSVALANALALEPSASSSASNAQYGIACWGHLMGRLARTSTGSDETRVESTSLTAVGDELLEDWATKRWVAAKQSELLPELFPCLDIRAGARVDPTVGSLILTGATAFASGLQQHLHKALLLVVEVDADNLVAVCINRPVPQPRRPPNGRMASRAGAGMPAPTRGLSARSKRSSAPLLGPVAVSGRTSSESDAAVHFGGPDRWNCWTCLVACGTCQEWPLGDSSRELLSAEPLGDSGLWRCHSVVDAWRRLRAAGTSRDVGQAAATIFARGVVRIGRLELELLRRRSEVGVVSELSPALRDVVAACVAYRGPAGSGVRLGLYGDHHGFGLWERAVSHSFHGGNDAAATATRGAVGDRALREWATERFGTAGDIGTPVRM